MGLLTPAHNIRISTDKGFGKASDYCYKCSLKWNWYSQIGPFQEGGDL